MAATDWPLFSLQMNQYAWQIIRLSHRYIQLLPNDVKFRPKQRIHPSRCPEIRAALCTQHFPPFLQVMTAPKAHSSSALPFYSQNSFLSTIPLAPAPFERPISLWRESQSRKYFSTEQAACAPNSRNWKEGERKGCLPPTIKEGPFHELGEGRRQRQGYENKGQKKDPAEKLLCSARRRWLVKSLHRSNQSAAKTCAVGGRRLRQVHRDKTVLGIPRIRSAVA